MLSRLGGEPARFGIRSLRHGATLGAVRDELEAALGVKFNAGDIQGELVFTCEVPASKLQLDTGPSEAATWRVYHLAGMADGEDIQDSLAAQLRKAGFDWYAPSRNEILEETGMLKDGLVDTDAIVALLTPRWLSWADGAERTKGIKLLDSIATEWLSAALRTSNPGRYLRRRKVELQERYVEPSARLRVLASYLEQR